MASEVAFRGLLFSDAAFMQRFRDPSLYDAHLPENDNYWKLRFLFKIAEGGVKPPEHPHPLLDPLLGWGDIFSRDTFVHNSAAEIGSRRAVLLYGDSFAQCRSKFRDEPSCFQGILNRDEEFSRRHFLLNYGIGGYGLDQIYLLLKNSLHLYRRPFVVVSLMTEDLDRSLLTVRDGLPKPYFQLRGNELVLQGTPTSSPSTFHAEHPPEIPSYLYRLILSNHWMPARLRQFLQRIDERREAILTLNQRILENIVDELKKEETEYIFLIFHPFFSLEGDGDWRGRFLVNWLTTRKIPYLSSKDLVSADASQKHKTISEYYLPNDGHPTPYQNLLVANELKRVIVEQRLALRHE
jgi:hypothetical protein